MIKYPRRGRSIPHERVFTMDVEHLVQTFDLCPSFSCVLRTTNDDSMVGQIDAILICNVRRGPSLFQIVYESVLNCSYFKSNFGDLKSFQMCGIT